MSRERLGVALTGHSLRLDEIRRLVRHADDLGYEVVLVDGDATLLPRRPDALVYDGTALLGAALASADRARVGSIRLPSFWQPVALARSLATLQELSSGRALGFFGVGAGRHDTRLGLPKLTPGQRVRRLDELLEAVRALLSGETVSLRGEFLALESVAITPPAEPVPVVVAAARPRALSVVERHADVWDANVPPLAEWLQPLREKLSRPIETWIWVFARPGAPLDEAAADFRRHSPWFRDLAEADVARSVVSGDDERCQERLSELRRTLEVDLLIVDLAGLDEPAARLALLALAPAKPT